jgi:hypothetical protein
MESLHRKLLFREVPKDMNYPSLERMRGRNMEAIGASDIRSLGGKSYKTGGLDPPNPERIRVVDQDWIVAVDPS